MNRIKSMSDTRLQQLLSATARLGERNLSWAKQHQRLKEEATRRVQKKS